MSSMQLFCAGFCGGALSCLAVAVRTRQGATVAADGSRRRPQAVTRIQAVDCVCTLVF